MKAYSKALDHTLMPSFWQTRTRSGPEQADKCFSIKMRGVSKAERRALMVVRLQATRLIHYVASLGVAGGGEIKLWLNGLFKH